MSEYSEHDKQGRSVGLVEKQFFTFAEPGNEVVLESGEKLGPITIAYETYGTLNADKSNAILVFHALSGDAHAAGYYSKDELKPGWWDVMIGPGKGIDTDKYFVISSNFIGSCMGSSGPSSQNLQTGMPYGMSFPVVTIGDMVRCQKALLDHLGVVKLLSCLGGSIGGMQALEWAVRYPEMVASAIPLATTYKHSALAIAFNEVGRQAIVADANWNGGNYYGKELPRKGLALARMVGHITYLSDDSMRRKFGRNLQDKTAFSFDFGVDFQVESYLRYQGEKFVDRFDANSYLYITKAADYFNLEYQHGDGSLVKAFEKTQAKFLVISFTSDWLYRTKESRRMVKAMKKAGLDVSFTEIEADFGHDAFLLANDQLTKLIAGFLARMSKEIR
ncbi:MAG: homoserine O-acetyltransferase [bacterium]